MYENDQLPETLQQVALHLHRSRQMNSPAVLTSFLQAKVFWLGFKARDARSLVWIADPWDADYLGVQTTELARESEILEAHNLLRINEDRQFASAGRELLLRARDFENGRDATGAQQSDEPATEWDIFISHASEDKESFVHPLANELTTHGVRVWYDKFTLKLGDSLREKIDYGLRYSRFGVVVLSPSFFNKDWPRRELDGLVALEAGGRKVILPVWHGVDQRDVSNYSPILAGRLAVSSASGLANVVSEIVRAIK